MDVKSGKSSDEERDDSRPFFQRKSCEVGIYLTVYDATSAGSENIGLKHFFLMKTTEQLYEECCKMDHVNIRATLERKRVFKNTYIERFEPGITLAVGFDSLEGLDAIWDLYRKSKLNSIMQELLITPAVLKGISAKSVTLETKLWEDEYEKCKKELEAVPTEVQQPTDRDGDLKMINRLKNYQTSLGTEVSSMRDLENEMESSRASFISCIYNILPENQKAIKSLNELEKITSTEKTRKIYNRKCIDLFYLIIKRWRAYFKTFDIEIVTPLLQIHQVCETQQQRDTKSKIVNSIYEMQRLLQPETSQHMTSYPEMAKKILRRDAPFFLGILSLVPMGVEKVSDIDLMLDEYMRDFRM